MNPMPALITLSRHPYYFLQDYIKFNLTYNGGRRFIQRYLEHFETRENREDFERRLRITYNPAFAAQALDEIKNGIYQRMPEIIRSGGTPSYTRAISGFDGGVDLEASTMDTFMGQQVLPELLKMGRTGVYVDMPQFDPFSTLAQYTVTPHPYLTWYRAEDILNWRSMYFDNELLYTSVLLRERHWNYNHAGLPLAEVERFRLIQLLPGGNVRVAFYEQFMNTEQKIDEKVVAEFILPGMNRLPFIHMDIGKSLLGDVADYQIALLNMASADLMYGINANFPFYVEGYDPKAENVWAKQQHLANQHFDEDHRDQFGVMIDLPPGCQPERPPQARRPDSGPSIIVGSMHGRRYPMESPPPAFIHPSSEPLKVSMEKQKVMQDEIRRLLGLNVANVTVSRMSAESKKVDQVGLESGLSNIGLELEAAEQEIALVWARYEGQQDISKKLTISYPASYSLKTDEQRVSEATEITALQGAAPSKKFQKEVAKLVAKRLLEGRLNQADMKTVLDEIDAAKYTTSDWQAIQADIQEGIVDAETASEARGYAPGIAKKAQKERVDNLAAIAAAQSPGVGAANNAARGIPDGSKSADNEKKDSQNPDKQPAGKKATRGAE